MTAKQPTANPDLRKQGLLRRNFDCARSAGRPQIRKAMKVSFQNLNKETITIATPLTDFASAYDKIK
jgi:hypothetical protein